MSRLNYSILPKNERIDISLTYLEKEKLKIIAKNKGMTVSGLIREYIKKQPKVSIPMSEGRTLKF